MKIDKFLRQPLIHRLDQSDAMVLCNAANMILMLFAKVPYDDVLGSVGIKSKEDMDNYVHYLMKAVGKMNGILHQFDVDDSAGTSMNN